MAYPDTTIEISG